MLSTNKTMVGMTNHCYDIQLYFVLIQFNVKSTYTDDLQGYTYVRIHNHYMFVLRAHVDKAIGGNELKGVSFY